MQASLQAPVQLSPVLPVDKGVPLAPRVFPGVWKNVADFEARCDAAGITPKTTHYLPDPRRLPPSAWRVVVRLQLGFEEMRLNFKTLDLKWYAQGGVEQRASVDARVAIQYKRSIQ